jgi:hypothetical protein
MRMPIHTESQGELILIDGMPVTIIAVLVLSGTYLLYVQRRADTCYSRVRVFIQEVQVHYCSVCTSQTAMSSAHCKKVDAILLNNHNCFYASPFEE